MSTKSVLGTTGRGGVTVWPEALKREIVAASYAPGLVGLKGCRHYDVNANQVFSWRKRIAEDCGRVSAGAIIPH